MNSVRKTTSTERVRAFRERRRSRNPPKQPPKSGAQRAIEFRARRRALKAAAAAGLLFSTPEGPTINNLQISQEPSTCKNASVSAKRNSHSTILFSLALIYN